jgi:hypothetical protein
MRCEPSFIAEQPKSSFASYVRNTTKNALTLKFPFIKLGRVRMSAVPYTKVRDEIRSRYATHYTKLSTALTTPAAAPQPRPQPELKGETVNPNKASVESAGNRPKWPM